MLAQSSLKAYVSCGTQTDLTLVLRPVCTCKAPSALDAIDHDEPTTAELGIDSGFSMTLQEPSAHVKADAYIHHSETSGIPNLSVSCSNTKPNAIGYNRPTTSLLRPGRVVSLPLDASQRKFTAERQARIVSMPEVGKDGFLKSYTQMQGGASDTSPDSDQKRAVEYNRTHPLDLPRTPSPPSSPDSIMIVGNDSTHVSTSFLRRSYTDEDGWVTWATSPPRPIPALHGPLSLPYARCPSGAEGTLVEGDRDELPHKIWGLGIDDAGSRSVNRTVVTPIRPPESAVPPEVPAPEISSGILIDYSQIAKVTAPNPHRDDIIDLSKPSTFYRTTDHSSVQHLPAFPLTAYTSADFMDTSRVRSSMPAAAGAAAVDIGLPGTQRHNRRQFPSSETRPLGTGHSGHSSFGNSSTGCQLNGSAPLFIPGSLRTAGRWAGAYIQPPAKEEKLAPHDPVSSQNYDLQQVGSPSTCSTAWSPVFPGFPVENEYPTAPLSSLHGPEVYSPPMGHDEQSARLLAVIRQIGNQDLGNISKGHSAGVGRIMDLNTGRLADQHDKGQCEYTKSYVSARLSDRSRMLPYQPRSVPLARLIHRRLSAVTEEESSALRQDPVSRRQKSEHHPTSELQSALESMILAGNDSRTEGAHEAGQDTTSVEVMPLETDSSAVVKLPNKTVSSSSAARPISSNLVQRPAQTVRPVR